MILPGQGMADSFSVAMTGCADFSLEPLDNLPFGHAAGLVNQLDALAL